MAAVASDTDADDTGRPRAKILRLTGSRRAAGAFGAVAKIMFLKERHSTHLVEVLNLTDLFDPHHAELAGRYHYGEEAQDPEKFRKAELVFPSGEALPRCWTDPHYRDDELHKTK